jgi:hypothetical protein
VSGDWGLVAGEALPESAWYVGGFRSLEDWGASRYRLPVAGEWNSPAEIKKSLRDLVM